MKYLDKLILPDKYIIKDPSGKQFKSIDDWLVYKKRKAYGSKRKNKKMLPYVYVLNINVYRHLELPSESGLEYAINAISKNCDIAIVYFTPDLSQIVFEKFIYSSDGFKDYHYLDFDVYYGKIRLDKNIEYKNKYSSQFKSPNNMPIHVSESFNMLMNRAYRTDFSYAYQCKCYEINYNGIAIDFDASNNSMGEIPIFCLLPIVYKE